MPKTRDQIRTAYQLRIRERLTDWRALLRRNPVQGRQVLQKVLTDRLVFEPQPDGFYAFRGTAVLDKILRGSCAAATTGIRPTGISGLWEAALAGKILRYETAA